jgi:hypothetical protein
MSLPMDDPRPADGTPPALHDRPRYFGRPPSGRREPRRRFERNPAARREILNEYARAYRLLARHAVCSLARVSVG